MRAVGGGGGGGNSALSPPPPQMDPSCTAPVPSGWSPLTPMWCFGGGGVTARADSGPINREGEVGRENQASLKSPKIQAWGAGGGH